MSVLKPHWEAVDIYHGPETFAETFARVRRDVGILYAAHFCTSEVCNGGLRQFFGNSTGVLAPEAVEGFRAIGQAQIADLVARVMTLLGSPYERDRKRRNELLDRLPEDTYDRIASARGDWNESFFKLIRSESGGFASAADRYAERISAEDPRIVSVDK